MRAESQPHTHDAGSKNIGNSLLEPTRNTSYNSLHR